MPPPRPVCTNMRELLEVLAQMREWRNAGMTDKEISARIYMRWVKPREAFYKALRDAKKEQR